MESLNYLEPKDVKNMTYNQLIAIVQETNRPPGGSESIRAIAKQAFINSSKSVLDIGTSTGFSAIELATLTHAKITAVDINEAALSVAIERARQTKVAELISFEQQNAQTLRYPNEVFDLVLCGNVTSIIPQREKARSEFVRVCKTGGFIAAIPMYYLKSPPEKLLHKVAKAIGTDVVHESLDYWMEFYTVPTVELYWRKDYQFDIILADAVEAFVNSLFEQPHLRSLRMETVKTLRMVYSRYMQLFRENLMYMGFTILLLRKLNPVMESQLFTAHPA